MNDETSVADCALCRGQEARNHDYHPMGILRRIRLAEANDLLDKAWAERRTSVSTGWPDGFTDDDPEWFADQQAAAAWERRQDEIEWIDPYGDT